jgi:hypothetical protein
LSYAFKGAQLNWATIEKEAYAIVETCQRLEYMLLSEKGFRLFTDHRNLRYIFSPEKGGGVLHRHTAAKLQRWSVIMRSFTYDVEFVEGERNVWADLLSRWGAATHSSSSSSSSKVRRILQTPLSPFLAKSTFEWPTTHEIAAAQRSCVRVRRPSKSFRRGDGLWCVPITHQIWIPQNAAELQTRICVIAHAGPAGHRGITSTLTAIKDCFYWQTIEKDVKTFVNQCIHCMSTKGSHKIPRLLGEAIHGDRPGDVLHMDYAHMYSLPKEVNEEPRHQYIHILMDDCTKLIWLDAIEEPDAASTAQSIETWAATFGMPRVWVSDGGSHYKNQVIEELSRRYGATHHITLAYCPWSNGTIENMVGQVKRVFKMLLSEYRLQQQRWPELMRMVQSALNSAPTERLGGRSPIEAMTGVKPMTAINSLSFLEEDEQCSAKELSKKLKEAIEELAQKRDQIHKKIAEDAKSSRDKHRERANAKLTTKPLSLVEGDYVLVADTGKQTGNNLRVKWRGPRRIVSIPSQWTYIVEDILQGVKKEVHASRIKLYRDKDLNITQEIKDHAGHVEDTLEVEYFSAIRKAEKGNGWEILTHWRGFEDEYASWEPLIHMVEAVRNSVEEYVREAEADGKLSKAFQASREYSELKELRKKVVKKRKR